MCRRAWKKQATGGMMRSRQNRALQTLSEVNSWKITGEQIRHSHGCTTLYRLTHGLVRTGRNSGEAVHRDPIAELDLLQHAAQGLRLAPAAAVRLHQGRLDRRAR